MSSDRENPTAPLAPTIRGIDIYGNATVTVPDTSTDNIAVTEYAIFLDGSPVPIQRSPSNVFQLTQLSAGVHTVKAAAIDEAMNISELSPSSTPFTVDYLALKNPVLAMPVATLWEGLDGTGSPIFEDSILHTKFSASGFKVQNNAGSNTATERTATIENIDLSEKDGINIWLYADGPMVTETYGEPLKIELALGDDVGMSSIDLTSVFYGVGGSLRRGWNNLSVNKSDISTIFTGTGCDWTNIEKITFKITFNATYTGNPFYIADVVFGTDERKTPVVLCLDGGHIATQELASVLNGYGVPTTLFVDKDTVKSVSVEELDIDQVKALHGLGNAVCFGSGSFDTYATNPELMQAQKDWLSSEGLTRNDEHLYTAYPNGSFNQATIDEALSIGLLGGRALGGKVRDDAIPTEETINAGFYENFRNGGIAEPFKILSSQATIAAVALAQIDRAIETGSSIVFSLQTIASIISTAELKRLGAGLKARVDSGKIECLTFPVYCKLYK